MSEAAPKRSDPEKKGDDAPPQRSNIALLLVVVAAIAGIIAVAFLASSGSPSGGAVPEQTRHAMGVVCAYTIDMPPGWHSLDVKELGKNAAPDLDLALARDDAQGSALILVEKIPPGFGMDARRYFEVLSGNMKKNSPGMAQLETEPLSQDPSNGFVQHVEMPDSKGVREGYLATLLTPAFGYRIVATAPKDAFAARKAELRQIIASFAPPREAPKAPPAASP
jgi:hypothetical protein